MWSSFSLKTQCNRTLSFLWASAQSVFRITHPFRSLNSVASGFFVAHAEREIKEVCQNRQSAALLSSSGLGSQYTPCARFLSTMHLDHSDTPSIFSLLGPKGGENLGCPSRITTGAQRIPSCVTRFFLFGFVDIPSL